MPEVRAEITANVWQVRVELGQMVDVGDELVVLESMKMEIPVTAPVAGAIAEIAVEPDTSIKEGDLVVVIDDGS
jgi:biotin carboxyl carrier protein